MEGKIMRRLLPPKDIEKYRGILEKAAQEAFVPIQAKLVQLKEQNQLQNYKLH